MQLLPVPDLNDSLLEAELDGATYFLHLAWNSEAGFWTLGVQDTTHATLMEGLPVLANTPLLGRYRTETMPPGEILAVLPDSGLDGGAESIGRAALPGGGISLVYVTEAELAVLTAAA